MRLLADCGARLDVVCNGFPLLHRAVKQESTEFLKILLEFRKALDINVVGSNGQTALHDAVNLGAIEHVRILIKAGADLNASDKSGETVLHRAADQNETAILSLILAQEDVNVDMVPSKLNSPLQVACLRANIDAVRALINKKADVERAIPGIFRSTPLMAALLPWGANRSEHASIIDTMARILVHSQAPVYQKVRGSRFYTALSIACFGAGVGTLNFLLDQGASVQLADPDSGRLPLHFAAANGIENLQAILLSYKGDLMTADKEGKNCLHWAAQMGNAQATKFILDRLRSDTPGAEAQYINQGDSDGWTPLCWAMRQCDGYIGQGMRSEKLDLVGVVRTLLKHGADPSLPGTLGSVRDGESSEMSDQFLRPEKLTPLELANRFGADHDIIKMLEDATGIRDSVPCVRWLRPSGDICDICLNVSGNISSSTLPKPLHPFNPLCSPFTSLLMVPCLTATIARNFAPAPNVILTSQRSTQRTHKMTTDSTRSAEDLIDRKRSMSVHNPRTSVTRTRRCLTVNAQKMRSKNKKVMRCIMMTIWMKTWGTSFFSMKGKQLPD